MVDLTQQKFPIFCEDRAACCISQPGLCNMVPGESSELEALVVRTCSVEDARWWSARARQKPWHLGTRWTAEFCRPQFGDEEFLLSFKP